MAGTTYCSKVLATNGAHLDRPEHRMHMNSFEALTWGTVATAIGSAFMLVMIGCGLAEPERGRLQGDQLHRATATPSAQAARRDAPTDLLRAPSLRESSIAPTSPADH